MKILTGLTSLEASERMGRYDVVVLDVSRGEKPKTLSEKSSKCTINKKNKKGMFLSQPTFRDSKFAAENFTEDDIVNVSLTRGKSAQEWVKVKENQHLYGHFDGIQEKDDSDSMTENLTIFFVFRNDYLADEASFIFIRLGETFQINSPRH